MKEKDFLNLGLEVCSLKAASGMLIQKMIGFIERIDYFFFKLLIGAAVGSSVHSATVLLDCDVPIPKIDAIKAFNDL